MKKIFLVLALAMSFIVELNAQKLAKDKVDDFTGQHIKVTDAKYIAKGEKYKIYWAMATIDGEYMVTVYLPYAVGGALNAGMYLKFKDATVESFDSKDINVNYGDATPNPGLDGASVVSGTSPTPWGFDVYNLDKKIIEKILSVHIDKIRIVMGDKVEDAVVSESQQEKIEKMIYLVK